MKDIMKSQNGVTLVQLTIYLIAMLVVIGMMTTLSNFFYGKINIIREASRYAAEFDKFNTHFVKDVESELEAIQKQKKENIAMYDFGSTEDVMEDE